jgi:hypothetical protein
VSAAAAATFRDVAKLCDRPGCSEPAAASYGMVPEDLLFWVNHLDTWSTPSAGVLCRRHADAMVVPRGWTLDDRREPAPRLFRPPSGPVTGGRPRPRRRAAVGDDASEQLELSGAPIADAAQPWAPAFDTDDDLGGLLKVDSPLLARAFRGAARARR